jgi:hypothetical protein
MLLRLKDPDRELVIDLLQEAIYETRVPVGAEILTFARKHPSWRAAERIILLLPLEELTV